MLLLYSRNCYDVRIITLFHISKEDNWMSQHKLAGRLNVKVIFPCCFEVNLNTYPLPCILPFYFSPLPTRQVNLASMS